MFRQLGQAMAQANVAVRRLARRTEPQPSIAQSPVPAAAMQKRTHQQAMWNR